MNKIEVGDILLSYLNFSEYFIICKDARKTHIRQVINHNGNPIDFYLHELPLNN